MWAVGGGGGRGSGGRDGECALRANWKGGEDGQVVVGWVRRGDRWWFGVDVIVDGERGRVETMVQRVLHVLHVEVIAFIGEDGGQRRWRGDFVHLQVLVFLCRYR